MNTRRPLDSGDLSPDSSDALRDGINGRNPSACGIWTRVWHEKLDAPALLTVRGQENFCWRGGYRFRCLVSVQAEVMVKIQAEQPNRRGRKSEGRGGMRGRMCGTVVDEGAWSQAW